MVNTYLHWKAWNYPPEPSETAKKVIRELHKLGRDYYRLDGPIQEYRVNINWLDIVYIFDNLKLNYEIDGPDHDEPEQIARDKKRDAFLKSKGWVITRISYKRVDKKGAASVAQWIIEDILKRLSNKDKGVS